MRDEPNYDAVVDDPSSASPVDELYAKVDKTRKDVEEIYDDVVSSSDQISNDNVVKEPLQEKKNSLDEEANEENLYEPLPGSSKEACVSELHDDVVNPDQRNNDDVAGKPSKKKKDSLPRKAKAGFQSVVRRLSKTFNSRSGNHGKETAKSNQIESTSVSASESNGCESTLSQAPTAEIYRQLSALYETMAPLMQELASRIENDGNRPNMQTLGRRSQAFFNPTASLKSNTNEHEQQSTCLRR